MSLRDFGELTQMSTSYLSKLENSELPTPKRQTVIKLATNLGIDPAPLLIRAGFVPDDATPSGDSEVVLMLYNSLNPGQQAAVKAFLTFVQSQGIEKITPPAAGPDTPTRDPRGNRWAKSARGGP